jgi:glycosyl transferase family 25
MESLLPPELQPEFTTEWDGPVDGCAIHPDSLRGYGLFPWPIPSENKWWNRPLKRGEIGCAVSHWLCWRRAQERAENLVLILEDDCRFVADCWSKLQAGLTRLGQYDPGWDLLYLGRERLDPDTLALAGIVRPGYSHCTYSYILRKRGIEALLGTAFDQAIIPVDEFLPAMYIDHPRADVRARYPRRLSAYAFEPPIVSQLPKTDAGSDTEASDFYVG